MGRCGFGFRWCLGGKSKGLGTGTWITLGASSSPSTAPSSDDSPEPLSPPSRPPRSAESVAFWMPLRWLLSVVQVLGPPTWSMGNQGGRGRGVGRGSAEDEDEVGSERGTEKSA